MARRWCGFLDLCICRPTRCFFNVQAITVHMHVISLCLRRLTGYVQCSCRPTSIAPRTGVVIVFMQLLISILIQAACKLVYYPACHLVLRVKVK